MKKLPLQSTYYQRLREGFADWLRAQGYAASSVYNMPNALQEFLHYLESLDIQTLQSVRPEHLRSYFAYLRTRKNQRRGGTIKASYLNKHRQALRKFSDYLLHVHHILLPVQIPTAVAEPSPVLVLTQEQVRLLYQQASLHPVLGWRDIALLEIFYSCGLRRSEGAALQLDDVLLERALLFVRKGKNYRQRYVPLTPGTVRNLQAYLQLCRPHLLDEPPHTALFCSIFGKPLTGQALQCRLKTLVRAAELDERIGLHSLRHSIATHLLQQGMPLDDIRRFLGHASLESTQLYTHLIQQL